MIGQNDIQKYGIIGAISAVLIQFIITKIFPLIPTVGVTFSSYVLNIREHVSGVETGLADWAVKLFGGQLTLPTVIMTAIGGALFMILAAILMDKINIKIKEKVVRLAAYLAMASLATSFILAGIVQVPAVSIFIPLAVNSVVVAFLMVELLEKKLNIISIPG